MARLRGQSSAALRVPGVYAAMVERERRKHRHQPRPVDPLNPSRGVFRRPDGLLKALEAGQPVVVPRVAVGTRFSDPAVELPWDLSVQFVRVTVDDRITPSRKAV